MWEFYLVTSQTAFEHGDLVVFQFQLSGRDVPFPATRDYLYRGGDEGALSTPFTSAVLPHHE